MPHAAHAGMIRAPDGHRFTGLPSTRAGRRALTLVLGGLGLVALAALLVRVAGLPSALGALGLLGAVGMVAGGAFALVAIGRRGERSVVVLIVLVLGLWAALLVVGELLSAFVDSLRH